MRILGLLLVVALNGALLWGWRDRERTRDELRQRFEEIERRTATVRQAAEHEGDVEALLETAREHLPATELDIDVLRDLLIAQERGLDIDRLSLEFRPDSSLPAAASGGAIQATLVGSFDAVSRYLGRIEALHLPLAPEELSLRRAAQGQPLTLTVRWSALWRVDPAAEPRDFTASELSGLERWIERQPVPAPKRNFFDRAGEAGEAGEGSRDTGEREETQAAGARLAPLASAAESAPAAAVPRLTGYVLARPELEDDPSRRVLAALRFEGELWLVKVGDVLGSFRVERIEARESVLLIDERTGERVKLVLE